MVLATYPSMSFGVQIDNGERCHLPPLILMRPEDVFAYVFPLEKSIFILSVPLLSELSWTFLLILMAHYSHLSPISVVLENCESHFYVCCLCWEPLKKKSSLLLIVGCLFYSSHSLFGSAGSAHYPGGLAPELFRSFQAGEWALRPLPKRSHFSCRCHCLRVKIWENSSPFPLLPAPHAAPSTRPVSNISLPPAFRNSSLVVSLCFTVV